MAEIVIGRLRFASKKACTKHFQEMLSRYKPGESLSVLDTTEFFWLLDRHPEREQKVGCGIRCVRVELHPVFTKQKCFRLYRFDGSNTDVSFLSCVSGKGKSITARWIEAMRNEVSGQIIAFKQNAFKHTAELQCELTGQTVNWHNCHVDHVTPFHEIAQAFLNEIGVAVSAAALEPARDNQWQEQFSDAVIAGKWAAYHMAAAKLRIVSSFANLSRPRKAGA